MCGAGRSGAGFKNVRVEGDEVDNRGHQPRVGEYRSHSLEGELLAKAILARSSLSVMI